jgi:1-acyl-sn-glycerol-3-phosphate acyltransferase
MATSVVPTPQQWRVPLLWRLALLISPAVVGPVCRLRVTGDVPNDLRDGPLILAANHIGAFDPIVLTAACAQRRIAPRIMATGGLFRAPVLGAVMTAFGHIRVDRQRANVIDALPVAQEALAERSVVLGYPEGRMTLDPGLWPERGKSGLARLAVASGVPVVPVAQWGAQLVLPWGAPRGTLGQLVWALTHRPVIRVHFGEPIDVTASGQGARAIREATDRIMAGIVAALVPLRPDEPRLPAWIDEGRPVSSARSFVRRSPQLPSAAP